MTTQPKVRFRSIANDGEEPRETFEAASDLCADSGLNYATSNYLLSWSMMHLLWVAENEDTDEVIGVVMSMTLDPTDVWKWNRLLPVRKRFSAYPPALYISDVVVAREYRNRWVATELLRGVIHYSRVIDDVPYHRTFALSRVPANGETEGSSWGVLRRLDFEEIHRFERFYADSDKFTCHNSCDLSNDPKVCDCEARLMMLKKPRRNK